MPIGYVNPLANPYIPQNTEVWERKLGQLQQRQDVAEEMMAKQRQGALSVDNVAPELREAYIAFQEKNYNDMIDKTKGNFAKNYDQVLGAINADVANPYHQLNKFVTEQAKLQQESQQRGGANYITTNDIYKNLGNLVTDVDGVKTIKPPTGLDYENLRHSGTIASDYVKAADMLTNDLKGTISKLGLSKVPGFAEFLQHGSFEELTPAQIKAFAGNKEVIEAWKKASPTWDIDNRPGYEFKNDAQISELITGVALQKQRKATQMQYIQNQEEVDERRRSYGAGDEEKILRDKIVPSVGMGIEKNTILKGYTAVNQAIENETSKVNWGKLGSRAISTVQGIFADPNLFIKSALKGNLSPTVKAKYNEEDLKQAQTVAVELDKFANTYGIALPTRKNVKGEAETDYNDLYNTYKAVNKEMAAKENSLFLPGDGFGDNVRNTFITNELFKKQNISFDGIKNLVVGTDGDARELLTILDKAGVKYKNEKNKLVDLDDENVMEAFKQNAKFQGYTLSGTNEPLDLVFGIGNKTFTMESPKEVKQLANTAHVLNKALLDGDKAGFVTDGNYVNGNYIEGIRTFSANKYNPKTNKIETYVVQAKSQDASDAMLQVISGNYKTKEELHDAIFDFVMQAKQNDAPNHFAYKSLGDIEKDVQVKLGRGKVFGYDPIGTNKPLTTTEQEDFKPYKD